MTTPNTELAWLNRVNPKLAEAYSRLPPAMSSRIASLVKKALPLRIHPDRLVKYAYLYVRAEVQDQGDAISKDHAIRSRTELAGELHGFQAGYLRSAEAEQRYRGGRKARQQIAASIESVLVRWKKVEQIVRKHRPALPLHLQPRFSDEGLARVRELVMELHNACLLDGSDVLRETGHTQELSEIAQTYIWWRFAMAPYRRKWADMHRLANVWRLSAAKDESTYRTVVCRICKGVSRMRYPFGSGWESILSEKS
jgi:hypothetical protein